MASDIRRPRRAGSTTRTGSVVSCWMCGTRLDSSKMLPDGGDGCHDIRWYCQDIKACTQRWTTSRRILPARGNLASGDPRRGHLPEGPLAPPAATVTATTAVITAGTQP